MNKKIIVIISLIIVVPLFYYYGYMDKREIYETIEVYINFNNYMKIDNYYRENFQYPDSLDQLDLSLDIERENYGYYNFYKDPFTYFEKYLRYCPIKYDGKNFDYIIYSVGPDGIDDNYNKIKEYNEGKIDHIDFKHVLGSSWIRNFKQGDMLIRYPYKAVDSLKIMTFNPPNFW